MLFLTLNLKIDQVRVSTKLLTRGKPYYVRMKGLQNVTLKATEDYFRHQTQDQTLGTIKVI